MRYLRLKSLTWWAGFVAIVMGVGSLVAAQYAPEAVAHLDFARYVLAVVFGWSDPSALGFILLGAGTIGLRDKFERMAPGV